MSAPRRSFTVYLRALVLSALLLGSAFSAHGLEAVRVADDVYAFVGQLGELDSSTGGNVGNSGFIVGSDAVVVVDTGISYRHGRAMLAAIRKITARPVELAVITHGVQEFVFGNAAFVEAGVPLLTHRRTADLMRQRCEHCLQNLRKVLGDPAMADTRLVIPEKLIDASTTIEIGGRQLELLHFGWGSTPGDLAMFDRRSGVLFAGGLVTNGQIPELLDGNLSGWLEALRRLDELPIRALVPGHGAVAGVELIDGTAAYLRALDRQVRSMYKGGASLTETVDGAALPAYSNWARYGTLHRRNVLHRYLQLEIEELQ